MKRGTLVPAQALNLELELSVEDAMLRTDLVPRERIDEGLSNTLGLSVCLRGTWSRSFMLLALS